MESNRRSRTQEMADAFLDEARIDLERAVAQGTDVPPRIRLVNERAGHATAEYRTLAVPIPPGAEGASPEALSRVIATYTASRDPSALLLVLDVVGQTGDGEEQPLLIAEARDQEGTRLFYLQPFTVRGQRVEWSEPQSGGWSDPGEEEMILDAAFSV